VWTSAGNAEFQLFLFNGTIENLKFWLFLIPTGATAIRRLHDIDRSGWWIGLEALALGLVVAGSTRVDSVQFPAPVAIIGVVLTLVVAVLLLVFFCLDGTRGRNRFGPDPKDPNADLDAEQIFG
jgi:uncharacterized membrane protein YhaH (DUF805 family)